MTFEVWSGKESLPTSAGNYALITDVTLSSTWTAPSGETNLCLNGHTITYTGNTDNGQAISISGSSTVLNLYDCDSETGGSNTDNGTSTSVDGVYVSNATFNLYDGMISGFGPNVRVENNGTFNMFGGTVTGNNSGVGVNVNGATFNMTGGSITGNGKERH